MLCEGIFPSFSLSFFLFFFWRPGFPIPGDSKSGPGATSLYSVLVGWLNLGRVPESCEDGLEEQAVCWSGKRPEGVGHVVRNARTACRNATRPILLPRLAPPSGSCCAGSREAPYAKPCRQGCVSHRTLSPVVSRSVFLNAERGQEGVLSLPLHFQLGHVNPLCTTHDQRVDCEQGVPRPEESGWRLTRQTLFAISTSASGFAFSGDCGVYQKGRTTPGNLRANGSVVTLTSPTPMSDGATHGA